MSLCLREDKSRCKPRGRIGLELVPPTDTLEVEDEVEELIWDVVLHGVVLEGLLEDHVEVVGLVILPTSSFRLWCHNSL